LVGHAIPRLGEDGPDKREGKGGEIELRDARDLEQEDIGGAQNLRILENILPKKPGMRAVQDD